MANAYVFISNLISESVRVLSKMASVGFSFSLRYLSKTENNNNDN